VAPRISLALVIHNHQPVGNFGWVIEQVFDEAYLPFVEALERHPGVRLALHYSGPLLEWLQSERPAFIERVGALVARGQVEILGGGFSEPVLASLPIADRVGQLRRMADELETAFGDRPSGAWLAERVWEPDLPTALVDGGYRWTILDDAHLRGAAVRDEDISGTFVTEDQGSIITVLATDQGLRYRIPFRPVDEVIGYLRGMATDAGDRLATMGDDGEKFGAWPTTWDLCWGKDRWVEQFLDVLEANDDWLTTVTPSTWMAERPPVGRVYMPSNSYPEMGEWALPPDEAAVFSRVLHEAVAEGRPEARWLRGGFWRAFQVRYREINDLHKQMLRTSAKVRAMPSGPALTRALDHLYRGQSNDCYWHGLFGGVYLAHMRLATYEHLIAAEDLADAAVSAAGAATDVASLSDLDLDGVEEALLATAGQVVTVDLAEGAGIGAWDVRAARHALGAVMRRRPEAYHETIRAAVEAGPTDGPPTGVVSIHELSRMKEAGLAARLAYDDHERRSGLVRFLPTDTTAEGWASGHAHERGDFVDRPFEVTELAPGLLSVARDGTITGSTGPQATRVTKTVGLGGDRMSPTLALTVTVENRSTTTLEAIVGVEWNVMLLGGGGNPAAWYELDNERSSHDGAGAAEGVTLIGQGNDHVGIALDSTVSRPARAWWSPIETISNSESGFERVYQGSTLLFGWPVRIEPGGRWDVRIDHAVLVMMDRAA
jgi:alpha-amylase